MDKIDELNKIISKVFELTSAITEESVSITLEKAPVIVHQRLCAELVKRSKKHPGEILKEVPEIMDVLITISVIEELYPKLKDK